MCLNLKSGHFEFVTVYLGLVCHGSWYLSWTLVFSHGLHGLQTAEYIGILVHTFAHFKFLDIKKITFGRPSTTFVDPVLQQGTAYTKRT